jgi:Fur family ferric uptake transcriptional regulator
VEEIDEDLLGDVEKIVESQWGFEVKDHRLTFHGICRVCQKQAVTTSSAKSNEE